MALVWGIRAFYMENMTSMDDAIERSLEVITENNLIGSGDIVVHTGSVPLHQRGQTNMIKISYIK
jgi:pyruvate kinase